MKAFIFRMRGAAMTEHVTRNFTIQILRYQDSDLLAAFSDDLPGLLVPARSHEELDERLPRAVKELLEAQGEAVSGRRPLG
jgi:hypothetical protein